MRDTKNKTPVAVIGASGYAGLELLRVVHRHPRLELVAVTASERRAGLLLGAAFPALAGLLNLRFEPFDAAALAARAEVAFVCLPHGRAAAVTALLHAQGLTVVDLSADFRLRERATYEHWYGPHKAPELFGTAVYGLPEVYAAELADARLIAAPGCYPTGALLPMLPFLRAGVVADAPLVVDSKSGVSGAGRKLEARLLLAELGENVFAYKVAAHRHAPEIAQEAARASGRARPVTFVPHLLPTIRGIASSVYLPLAGPLTAAQAHEILADTYAAAPFVRVRPAGETPELAHVRGSNFCDVAAFVDERAQMLVALSTLDNLVKGSGGQGVQALNLALGWGETTGLGEAPLHP